jgi:hypothetical protein
MRNVRVVVDVVVALPVLVQMLVEAVLKAKQI